MDVFILIAVSEPTVINVIISVSAAIAAVFIIIVIAVITDAIGIIFVISIATSAAIGNIIFFNIIIVLMIISNISPRCQTFAIIVIDIVIPLANFVSIWLMKGVIGTYNVWWDNALSAIQKTETSYCSESDGQLGQDPFSLLQKKKNKNQLVLISVVWPFYRVNYLFHWSTAAE